MRKQWKSSRFFVDVRNESFREALVNKKQASFQFSILPSTVESANRFPGELGMPSFGPQASYSAKRK